MLIWKMWNKVMTDEDALTALCSISFIALIVMCLIWLHICLPHWIMCLSRMGLSRRHELIQDELIQEEGKRLKGLWETPNTGSLKSKSGWRKRSSRK